MSKYLSLLQIFLTTLICLIANLYTVVEVNSLATPFNTDKICEPLKQPSYQVHSQLSLYESSKKLIDQYVEQNKSSPVFGLKTLLEEHNALTSESCKPVSFYFLGRHAARYPSDKKIEKYNKNLNDLKENLKQLALKLKDGTLKVPESGKNCLEKFDKFIEWVPKMTPKQDNLITELGGIEEQNIARRFKQIYPEFFDAKRADINVGVTSKIRTAETEVQFMKLVDGYVFPSCENVPTNDVNKADYNADTILQHKCYKNLMDKEVKEFLQFHSRCKKSLKKSKLDNNKPEKDPMIEKLKKSEVVEKIVDKVSKRLYTQIDFKTLDSIMRMCIHETASNADGQRSIWCSMLDDDDIKTLEYITDAKSYIDDSYGPDSNIKQACPLIGNLVDTVELASKEPDALAAEKRKAYFYFSHDHALKKVIPYLGLFRDDEGYSEKAIDNFVKNGIIPEDREFKMHRLVPFSGNFAFIVYRCQKESGKPVEHKLLTTLNERPIKIGGCNNQLVCDVKSFVDNYMSAKTDCSMEKICPL